MQTGPRSSTSSPARSEAHARLDRRGLVIGACGASAGVHAGLVPDHLKGAPWEAVGFLSAALLLVALAVFLARFPERLWPSQAAAGLFAGLLGAYAVTRLTEPLNALGLATKAIELVGLIVALRLEPEGARGREPVYVVLFGLCAVLFLWIAAGAGHGHAH